MATALDTARYLVHLATPSEDEDTDCLCHLRLQKLLYYVQGWHLAATGAPLFPERIEAWQHGPVVRNLYPIFKDFRLAIPPTEGAEPDDLSEGHKDFIRSIWGLYARFSATALRDMTHRESPWVDARAGLAPTEPSNEEITKESLRAYFFPRYVDLMRRKDSRIEPVRWQEAAAAIAAGRVRTAKDIRRELHNRRAGANPG